jgi:acyl carrier protein
MKEIVFKAIDELNDEFKTSLKKSEETKLLGEIDSLALVNLIVIIENLILQHKGKRITIADDRAFSQKNSPFKTVGSLISYLNE